MFCCFVVLLFLFFCCFVVLLFVVCCFVVCCCCLSNAAAFSFCLLFRAILLHRLFVFVLFLVVAHGFSFQSRVKSVRLDNWKPSEVEDMKKMGNEASNKQFLRLLEPLMSFYPSPKLPEDGSSVREQWIRAKYERKEFCLGLGGMQLQIIQMPIPLLEDWVVKRGAKRKNWKKRWCVVLGTR